MFVAYFCGKGSSMTPITKYMNNEIKQDMIKENKYFTDESDEKNIYRYETQQRIYRQIRRIVQK